MTVMLRRPVPSVMKFMPRRKLLTLIRAFPLKLSVLTMMMMLINDNVRMAFDVPPDHA